MPAKLIEGFIQDLRRRGVSVSPAERIDASQAALVVGLESRASFRTALMTTLAKTREARALFGETFDAWFKPPRPVRRRRKGRGEEGGGEGRRHGPSSGGGRGRPERVPAESPEERPRRGRGGSGSQERPRSPRREEAVPSRERPDGRLRRVLSSPGRRSAREGSGHRLPSPSGGEAGADPRKLPLFLRLSAAEEERLAREIPALVRQIRLRRGRRYRGGSRGRLWLKRTLRESLAHGGVPFTLPMQEHRPRQPRIVILVDVSRSVARAAGLFLLLCHGLSERIRKSTIYFFVDRMIEGTDHVHGWVSGRPAPRKEPAAIHLRGGRREEPASGIRPFLRGRGERAFAELLESLPGLNPAAPSDYGRAFFHARVPISRATGRDTVLVILGDARNNRADPLAWTFEEIAGRCRRVIWLNPEPRDQWEAGDAVMSAYLPYCDVACEVTDLDALAAGVREILRSL